MDVHAIRKILCRHDTDNTWQVSKARKVNVPNSRVRVGASQDSGMEQPWKDYISGIDR
jgi:hypothetical protein